jgi:hypothetical protein
MWKKNKSKSGYIISQILIPGKCIPEWFGLGHSIVISTILENSIKCPVTHNGVIFTEKDIAGLSAYTYDTPQSALLLGERCFDEMLQLDSNGRYVEWGCRDISPDLFHIALSYTDSSLVMDAEVGKLVDNSIILGYDFNIVDISIQEGIDLAGIGSPERSVWPFNGKATHLKYVKMNLRYHSPTKTAPQSMPLEYILELKMDQNLQTLKLIGGEWIRESRTRHPDFLWIPLKKPEFETGYGQVLYDNVRLLLDKSNGCSAIPNQNELNAINLEFDDDSEVGCCSCFRRRRKSKGLSPL